MSVAWVWTTLTLLTAMEIWLFFIMDLTKQNLPIRHMSQALLLLSLSSGPDHPDAAATYINVAMMYQDLGKMDTALRYLQEALKKNERLLGEEHIQTAVCYHALAIAFNCMGAFKLSHQVREELRNCFGKLKNWCHSLHLLCTIHLVQTMHNAWQNHQSVIGHEIYLMLIYAKF